MEIGVPIIIIDDDRSVVSTIENIVNKIFSDAFVYKSYNGLDGLDIIHRQKKPFVVISNVNMQGLSGMQILKKVRSDETFIKDAYFIMITSLADKELNLKVIKEGADDFLNKPFSVDNLIVKLRNALRHTNLKQDELGYIEQMDILKEQMQINYQKTIDAFVKLIRARYSKEPHNLDQIESSTNWIARQMSDKQTEISAIADASKIFNIGKMYLDDAFLERPVLVNGIQQTKVLENVPAFAKEVIGNLNGFKKVSEIIGGIYENFDGSGIPNRTKSWEIPLGARILRVAIDFQFFINKFKNPKKAIDGLFHEVKRLYDYRVVAYLDQYLAHQNTGFKGNEKAITVQHLSDEMVLTRNIITDSGLMLMSAGTLMTSEKIERIGTIIQTDPIIGKIYIKS